MRILVNAVGAQIGGAITHLRPFLRHLSAVEPGWELHVHVSPGQAERLDDLSLAAVVEWKGRGLLGRVLWDLRGVSRAARDMGADCILNLTNCGPVTSTVPSVLFERNAYYFDRAWLLRLGRLRRLEARARRALAFREMASAVVVVTPTRAMADFLRSWRGCPGDVRFAVVPHAVDGDRFAYRPRPLAGMRGIRLAVVSNPGRQKGFEVAVRLTAELARRGYDPALHLTIEQHDKGAYRRSVREVVDLVRELGLDDRVVFLGNQDDPLDVYTGADVVVVPSYTESFGFPLAEAMGCGTPVLGSGIPALMEVGGDSVTWFPPGDFRKAADCLEAMAARSRADALGSLARARTRVEELTWDHNAGEVAALVRGAVEGAGGRRSLGWLR